MSAILVYSDETEGAQKAVDKGISLMEESDEILLLSVITNSKS